MIMIDFNSYLKQCLSLKNLNFTKLAELTGQAQSNLANKVSRNNYRIEELESFANVMGADVEIKFIDRTTGLPIGEQQKTQPTQESVSLPLETVVNELNVNVGKIYELLKAR